MICGSIGYVLLTAAFRSLSRPSSSYSSLGIRHKPVIAWPYYLFCLEIIFRNSPFLKPSSGASLDSFQPFSFSNVCQRSKKKSFGFLDEFSSKTHELSFVRNSYKTHRVLFWNRIELNYRPPPYQSGALTNWATVPNRPLTGQGKKETKVHTHLCVHERKSFRFPCRVFFENSRVH